jgi:hypothetical protein
VIFQGLKLVGLYLLLVAIGAVLNLFVFDDPPFERSTFTISLGVLLGLTLPGYLRRRKERRLRGFSE